MTTASESNTSAESTPPDPGRLSARLHALATSRIEENFVLRDVFDALSGRGHAALLVVLALPFCLPIPLPGLSVIFGGVLAFIGLRIAFAQRPWLPRWVLNKPVKAETVRALAEKSAALERRTRKILRPRLPQFCQNKWAMRSHGCTVAVLAMLLALPLPIPFSNIPAALPILILGLALLEDDGLYVIVGYAAAWIAVGIFVGIAWASGVGLSHFWHAITSGGGS